MGGSCPCPRRFIWGWGPKGEEASRTPPPLKVQVPHLRESSPSRMKPALVPVILARTCINLTQNGLKTVRFMQTLTPRGRRSRP